jgi:hypothetical protein
MKDNGMARFGKQQIMVTFFKGKGKRILAGAGIGILIFLVLLLTFALLLPRLINLEPFKNEILAALSQRAGGDIRFHKIDIAFFPRPHVTLQQGTLSADGLNGKIESVVVYPEILPLFTGKIRLSAVELVRPRIDVSLPEGAEKTPLPPAIDKRLGTYLDLMASEAPGLSINIENGSIRLTRAENALFRFEDVNAHFVLPPERFRMEISAKSNLWEKISLKGWVNSRTLDGTAEINLVQFRPQELPPHYYLSDLPVRFGDSGIDLNLHLETERLDLFRGTVRGSIPGLTLSRGAGTVTIKGRSFKGAFYRDSGRSEVSLEELDLVQPQVSLSGRLETSKGDPGITMEIMAKRADIGSIRQAALNLAGDRSAVTKIFEIVRGGISEEIAVNSRADSFDALGDLENIEINGTVSRGEFYIPAVESPLKDVEGKATISRGILTGQDLTAKLEDAIGRKGTLKLGLRGDPAPFHLDILVQSGLKTVRSVLEKLIKEKQFTREMALLRDLNGRASGRLILGETTRSIKPTVRVSDFSLTAGYQRIPFPLTIKGGQFFYEKDKISLLGISGQVGRSSFSQLSSSINWKDVPSLEAAKGKWQISMDEVYPWIASLLGTDFSGNVQSLQGMLSLDIIDLKGELLKPKDWKFRVTGVTQDLLINTTRLPGPLSMAGGRFEATPSDLSVRDLEASLLGTSLKITGILKGYLGTFENLDLNLEGRLGRRVVRWLFDLIDIPPQVSTRGPFTVSSSHLVWAKGKETSLSGEFVVGKGPKISLDLVLGPRFLNLRRLLLEDEISRAFVSIDSREKTLGIRFNGSLQAKTLDRLVENPFLTGWARGDIQVDVNLEKPVQSTGQGTLQAEGLLLPGLLKEPLNVEKLHFNAAGNRVRVESATVALGEMHLSLKGDLNLAENSYLLQMDLSGREMTWENLEEAFKGDEKNQKGSLDVWALPLRGRVGIRLEQFRYKNFSWSPVTAELAFHPKEWVITVQEAVTCQISTLGFLRFSPQGLRQDLTLIAKDKPLGAALSCLSNSDRLATGKFEFQGRLNGIAGEDPFLQSMDGDFRFTARKGRIFRFTVLARIFALLDVTEILRGKLPDLNREGLPFDILRASGNMKNGRVTVKRGILDGPSMKIAFKGDLNLIERKMDIVLLVVPFKTLDDIIRHIPLLGTVLGKTLTSIPVQVTGDFANPMVLPLSPSAVGSELLDLLQRTLGLPLKLIELFIPGKQGRE